ncbi:hypothetical protein [Vibrio furnissii]|uniref:hypothetical protein n=1 Tax=Vibrio furnissii TaxID=29494 RepID=UPI001EEA6C78|nr:hypothetical protein [Vibrio furnissii]MCG6267993.1 hypothetical protein [Vibrio furnissii]
MKCNNWSESMLRMLLGIPPKRKSKARQYEIKPKMVSPDVVQMDMVSFKNSKVVKRQIAAAKKAVRRENAHA